MYLKDTQVDPVTYVEAVNGSMTQRQFIKYAYDVLSDEALESLYEAISEFNSEVAMFGDAGPGAGYRLRKQIQEVNAVELRLAILESREPRDFRFRMSFPR